MKIKTNKADLGLFFRTGIIVLSFFAIVFTGIEFVPAAITVTSHTNSKKIPIHSVETNKKVVGLTFDLDRDHSDLEMILNILKDNNIKATFFVTGQYVENNPEGLKTIAEAGHDLGNHTYNHGHMDLIGKEECVREIKSLHNKVREITGEEMWLFRPPYGDFNNTCIHTAKELGYKTVNWNIDSEDWKDYSTNYIFEKATEKEELKNGSIILFHVGAKYTTASLEDIILRIEDQGYNMVPLSDLIYKEEFTIDMTGRQYKQ